MRTDERRDIGRGRQTAGRGTLPQQAVVVGNEAHGHARIAGDRGGRWSAATSVTGAGEHLLDEALEERRFRKPLARGCGREAFLEIGADPGREMRAAVFHAAHLNQTAAERLSCTRADFAPIPDNASGCFAIFL